MHNSFASIRALFAKEMRGYFNSPVAYIVITAFLLISGWFFASNLFLLNEATISPFLANAPLLFVFIIPAVCMRLFTEETKAGTIKILTTLPLTDGELIAAKYLSATALVVVAILGTLVYPVTVAFLGPLDGGQVVSSYLGLILLGAFFVSIGLFASSLTRNQVVAFIIGLFICFALFVAGQILFILPPAVAAVVDYVGIGSHFDTLAKGLLDTRDLVYFGSGIAFFLILTRRAVKSRAGSETKLFSADGASLTAILLGAALALNLASGSFFGRFDLSSGRLYSLSPASKQLLRSLPAPVTIKAYFTRNLPAPYGTNARYFKDLLAEYRTYARGKVTSTFIDPSDKEDLLRQVYEAGIPPVRFTQVQKDKYEVKEGFMGAVFESGGKKETIPLIKDAEGLEYDITSTIKKLTDRDRKVVGFLQGHKESDLASHPALQPLLQSRYAVRPVDLKGGTTALAGLDTLVIAGPKLTIPANELYLIDQFLMSGKTVGFFTNRENVDLGVFFAIPSYTGLDTLLSSYSVTLNGGLVLDLQNRPIGVTQREGFMSMTTYVNYPFIPVVTDFRKDSVIVKDLEAMALPFAAPLTVTAVPGVATTVIARSSRSSWHSRDLRSLNPMQRFEPGKDDPKGPFPLVVTAEGVFPSAFAGRPGAIAASKPARILVCGSAHFIESLSMNTNDPTVSFFLNAVDWLVQDEALISIRSKGSVFRPLREIPPALRLVIKYFAVFLMPVLFIVYGLLRWHARIARKAVIANQFK